MKFLFTAFTLFDTISATGFPETTRVHEVSAMLLANKEIRRSLLSRDFIMDLEKSKANIETKKITRRLLLNRTIVLNGTIAKLSSSFRTPTNYLGAKLIRRIKFPHFSQKSVINTKGFQTIEESPDV